MWRTRLTLWRVRWRVREACGSGIGILVQELGVGILALLVEGKAGAEQKRVGRPGFDKNSGFRVQGLGVRVQEDL